MIPSRQPKRKIVSGNFKPPVIPHLTPAEWSELEVLLHASIPPELRKQLFAKLLLYSCAAPASRPTISVSKAVRAIKVWQSHSSIRLELTNYSGEYRVNVRRWFLTDSGELKPTRHGFTLPVKRLPALRKLVRDAMDRARSLGLLVKTEGGE